MKDQGNDPEERGKDILGYLGWILWLAFPWLVCLPTYALYLEGRLPEWVMSSVCLAVSALYAWVCYKYKQRPSS